PLAKQNAANNSEKPRDTTYRPNVISDEQVDSARSVVNSNSDFRGLDPDARTSVRDLQSSLLSGQLGNFEKALQHIQSSPDREEILARVSQNLWRSNAAIKLDVNSKDESLMLIDVRSGMSLKFHRLGVYEGRYSTAPNGVGAIQFSGPMDDRGVS